VEWKISRFEEGTDYDRDRGFYRFKRAVFTVNGTEHTLRISMKDFEEGNAPDLVEREVNKISAVLDRKGSGRKMEK
jgi:hypothetical protein